jgi:16S rRNA (uracil1498-N3)-methyltransferase
LAFVHSTTDSHALGRPRSWLSLHTALDPGQRVIPRIFCPSPLAAGTTLDLAAAAAHHVLRVLRLQAGDALTLFDGAGGEYYAELAQATRRGVAVRVIEHRDIERESPLTVTLVQGLAAADRMDQVLQKAVELGAAAIAPVVATRSVARLEGVRAERRVEHWRQIVIAACEQCGRNRLPQVHVPCALATWLSAPSAAALRVLLLPEATAVLGDLGRPAGAVELLVGPEGGFTVEESAAARAAGFRPVRLGPRIMRTETAGAAVLAAMHALWGDWR